MHSRVWLCCRCNAGGTAPLVAALAAPGCLKHATVRARGSVGSHSRRAELLQRVHFRHPCPAILLLPSPWTRPTSFATTPVYHASRITATGMPTRAGLSQAPLFCPSPRPAVSCGGRLQATAAHPRAKARRANAMPSYVGNLCAQALKNTTRKASTQHAATHPRQQPTLRKTPARTALQHPSFSTCSR